MTVSVALLVLASAVLHASWNAVVRINGDKLAMITLLATFGAVIALPGLFLFPLPHPDSWPWLAASVALHLGYNIFLANAYAHGELGKVYPIARGTAPLLTLLVTATVVGETVAPLAALGIVVLGLGILALTFDRGLRVVMDAPRGVLFALGTSVFIAGYTLSDGMGARLSGNALSYTLWLFFLDGIPLTLYALWARGRGTVDMIAANWKPGIAIGVLSLSAYAIAIWAMTVAPIALVAALRETSVVFALIIAWLFLGERMGMARVVSVAVVFAGLVLMRL